MTKGRLEAFSDGVIAIIITIMVLELHAPESPRLEALQPLIPIFLSYLLSFALLGTWWNNHHHLLHAAKVIDARVLWANLHLLFWLSLFPFGTAWVGQNDFAPIPVATYGVLLFMAGGAYFLLVRALIHVHGQPAAFAEAIGRDAKGKASSVAFALAIPIALVAPSLSMLIYVGVVVMWVVPDRRMERVIRADHPTP
ncbi:MAG TPA: TMEM175 family protein [Methylomirabilota bacterium]|nr:TMEM175 family protein [Methylomirabilota bacterium]